MDVIDSISGFVSDRPWQTLGIAIVCVLLTSICISVFERRGAAKRARDAKRQREEQLRSRDR